MKKSLYVSKVLVYYDLPELFLARDDEGIEYLCMLVKISDRAPDYIAIAISETRLLDFLTRKRDLRTIFTQPEQSKWYWLKMAEGTIEAEEWKEETLPEEYLPAPGCFYEADDEPNDIGKPKTNAQNDFIIKLDITKEKGGGSVDDKLIHLVCTAYKKSLEECFRKILSRETPPIFTLIGDIRDVQVEIQSKFRNYCTFRLLSSRLSDNAKQSFSEIVLRMFDETLQTLSHRDRYSSSIPSVKGHEFLNLKNFVKVISDNDIKLYYSWLKPGIDAQHSQMIDKDMADDIYKTLKHIKKPIEG